MVMATCSAGFLIDTLVAQIAEKGPIPVSSFMEQAARTYYARGQAFGEKGDFTTAPEVCQVFGEIVGLWLGVVWQSMGSPAPMCLAELGPGRGTLMADILRVACRVPGFSAALSVHLVEQSVALRQCQRQHIASVSSSLPVTWHSDLDTLPEHPILFVANEFFDALPIEQFEATENGWMRRYVQVGSDQGFEFVAQGLPIKMEGCNGPKGTIMETCPAAQDIVQSMARRISRNGGGALIFDYGYEGDAYGDTLQAVRHHAYVSPLYAPGTVDLSAHVNFGLLGKAARVKGACVWGPVEQGRFLARLGAEQRAKALIQNASEEQALALSSGVRRLIHPQEMGVLFKVLAISHDELPVPPGFECFL